MAPYPWEDVWAYPLSTPELSNQTQMTNPAFSPDPSNGSDVWSSESLRPQTSSPGPAEIVGIFGTPVTPPRSPTPLSGLTNSLGQATGPTPWGGGVLGGIGSQASMPQSGNTYSLAEQASLAASYQHSATTINYQQPGWGQTSTWYTDTANAACPQHGYYAFNLRQTVPSTAASSLWVNYHVMSGAYGSVTISTSPPLTPEQRAAQEKLDAFHAHIAKKAEKLLVALLTSTQKKMWMAMGMLLIPSASVPGVVYRLSRKTGLIRMYKEGVPEVDLCIHENEGLPLADRIIAMKFLIDAEEPELHRIANKHAIPAEQRAPLRPELLKLARAA